MSKGDSADGSIHVLWALSSMEMGGTEMYSLEVIPRLMRHVRVTVLLTERRGELFEKLQATGVEIVKKGLRGKFNRRRILKAQHLIQDLRPDIAHTHSLSTHYLIRVASILAEVPAILPHHHGMVDIRIRDAVKQRERRLLNCTDRVLFVSRAMKDNFRDVVMGGDSDPGRHDARFEVIHDGVDLQVFARESPAEVAALRAEYGIPEGAPVIGNVGRLAEIKNPELTIEMLAHLKKRIPEVRCVWVGDGPEEYRAELQRLCEARGVSENMIFAGFRRDTAAHFALFDVSFLTSHSEGLPRSVLESLASGTPIVAPEIPGLDEIIEDGVTGFLAPRGDAEGFAERVGRLLADPELRAGMADRARQRGEAYDFDRYTERLVSLYRSVLEGPDDAVERARRAFRTKYAVFRRI